MQKPSFGIILALSIGAGVLLSAAPGRAQTYHFYHNFNRSYVFPGSMCKYYGKQASDDVFSFSGGNANGIKNSDTAPHYAVCPLIRTYYEMSSDYDTFSFAALNVSGTSWSLSDCDMRTTSWDGTSNWVHSTPTLTTTPGGSQYKWSDWNPPEYSTSVIWCGSVRPGEWIRKYEMRETFPDNYGED